VLRNFKERDLKRRTKDIFFTYPLTMQMNAKENIGLFTLFTYIGDPKKCG